MREKITNEQVEKIYEAGFDGIKEYHRRLEEYTGIEAVAYTVYSYYDSAGNYLGDSNESGLMDLLKATYIEVTDNE